MPSYYLAQVNIARMLAPLEDPLMTGFVTRLDELNALADRSPGFVWRLQTEAGNATYIASLSISRFGNRSSILRNTSTVAPTPK
jgi:hypothetical protein